MRQQRISNQTITAGGSVNNLDRLQNFTFSHLIFGFTIGGSGHVWADFDKIFFNITLKKATGGTIQIAINLRASDLLKYSDFVGGFSTHMVVTNGVYWASLPIGCAIVDGDDIIEVSTIGSGLVATTTCGITIDAVDGADATEVFRVFESVPGTGATVYLKDVESVFLTSAPTGVIVPIKDQEYGSMTPIDSIAKGIANCFGQMETLDDIGILWNDRTGCTQDVEVTPTNNSQLLVVRKAFYGTRLDLKRKQQIERRTRFYKQLKQKNPDRFNWLVWAGVIPSSIAQGA